MNRVVITGSWGFLGSYITKEFSINRWQVIGVNRPPPSTESAYVLPGITSVCMPIPSAEFAELLSATKPNLLVHAAGSASVPESLKNPDKDFLGSVQLTFGVLDALRRCSPGTRILYLSSAAVYGNPTEIPIHETTKISPISPYGFHKMICEQLLEEFFRVYQIKGCSVRIFSAYGSGLKKQVIWDICEKVLHEKNIVLHGSGSESRDFIHASDVARSIRIIAERGEFKAEPYNVANGAEVSIKDLASALIHSFMMDKQVKFSGVPRAGDPLRWRADISRLKALGYYPSVSLEEGLKDYVVWVTRIHERID